MPRVEGDLVIERPLEEVFDFVADERNEPRFNPRMLRAEKVSPGPIGLGTRFTIEMATGRRRTPMTIELIRFERPRRLASSTHLSSMDIYGTLVFEPVPEGTRMRWEWEVVPHGVLKLASPLIEGMGRRQEERIWAGLKRFLEARAESTGRAGRSETHG